MSFWNFPSLLLYVLLFCFQALVSVEPKQILSFPRDHSFHSEYQLEWCYFVGNLTVEGGELGYELSFFRADFGKGMEVFPVHFAISDIANKKHSTAQVLERKYGNLAGYTSKEIWSGDYRLEFLSSKEFRIQAKPRDKRMGLDLQLSILSEKEILPQGKNGFSPKSYKYPEYNSFYYSIPRMQTKGWLEIGGQRKRVLSGTSWMDHEWSEPKGESKKVSLGNEENSWDWVCLNLSDGTDIMAFNFRKTKEEKSETFATVRKPTGEVYYLHEQGKVILHSQKKFWKSQRTLRVYPLEWSLSGEGFSLEIYPKFEDQEFIALETTGNIYWEGAMLAKGKVQGKEVTGQGYLELKGNQKSDLEMNPFFAWIKSLCNFSFCQ